MRGERGFQRGPDIGALVMAAALAGIVAWAIGAYGGTWWEKLLVGAGTLAVWIVGGFLGCLLFGGVLWLCFAAGRLKKKAALRRLLRHDAVADPAGAIEQAEPLARSLESAYDDILRADSALCRELTAAAGREGPLQRPFLRILMNHAPWSPDAEAVLYDGKEALEPRDLWSWLYWFRMDMPRGNPQYADRLASALAFYLARAGEHDRRRAWHDCLPLAGDGPAWHRLAARHRQDLDALRGDERLKLDEGRRQSLERLMHAAPEAA